MKTKRIKSTQLTTLLLGTVISCTALSDDFAGSVQGHYLDKTYSADDDVSTTVKGIYAYLGYGKHSLELELDSLSVNVDDTSQQDDKIVVYRNYQIPNWQFSAGVHQADITNIIYTEDTDSGTYITSAREYDMQALILGAKYTDYYYGFENWLAGINIISASYDNNELSNFTQISPYYGSYYSMNNRGHYVYAGIELHTQFFNDETQGETLFIAPEVSLKYVANNTSYYISGQFGDNINQFTLGGFSYEGNNVIHTSNIAFGIAHNFTPAFYAKAGLKYQHYISQLDEKESMAIVNVAFGYNF